MLIEQLINARSKRCVSHAQRLNLGWRNPCAKFQPLAYRRRELIEVSCVNPRCRLPRLDRRVDLDTVTPPADVDLRRLKAQSFKLVRDGMKGSHDLRFAIVQIVRVDYCKAAVSPHRQGSSRCKQFRQQRTVFKIAKKPAHRIEGLSKVSSTTPIAATLRCSITCEPAKCCRSANRTSGISSNRGNRRTLEHARGRACSTSRL